MKNEEIHIHFHFSKKGLLRSLRIGLVAAALATPVVLFAGTVVRPVPFDFQAGTPIVAAEVNAIHNAIADAVDSNAADIAALSANACTITLSAGFATIDCGSGGSTRTKVEKRVFLSSTVQRGNSLGGIAGGDAICQQLADASSLGGTYRAWLSDDTQDAVDAVSDVEYQLVDGTVVAQNKADLIDGIIKNAINMNEDGNLVTSGYVWTGSGADGGDIGIHCNRWNSGGATGAAGSPVSVSSTWSYATTELCNRFHQIYCFEQ